MRKRSICCDNGKFALQPFPAPPEFLMQLWIGQDIQSRLFREFVRSLNNSLALASMKVKEFMPPGSTYNPSVVVQGKPYHRIGPLQASTGDDTPKFAQIYVHDPLHENEEASIRLDHVHLPQGISSAKRDVLHSLLVQLQNLLHTCNPYVRDFKTACEIQEVSGAQLVINANVRPAGEHVRRYNSGLTEISVLVDEEPGPRDIVVHLRDGGLQTIADTHRSHDALHFVLLFPYGTDGWHLGLTHSMDETKRLTAMKFYSFHLQQRYTNCDAVLRGGRLFQEYCCMAFAKIENQWLYYLRTHQGALRADLCNNVYDAAHAHDATGASGDPAVGQHIIIPASHLGSPRDMHTQYQDAVPIVREYHKPDLFITFTCNPNWPELMESLLPGQRPDDRPDLVARVFNMKLNSLNGSINEGEYFWPICCTHPCN